VGEVPRTLGNPNQIKMTPKEILSRKCPYFCAQPTIRSSNLLYDVTVLISPHQTLGPAVLRNEVQCEGLQELAQLRRTLT
jgi:hypothetical protein